MSRSFFEVAGAVVRTLHEHNRALGGTQVFLALAGAGGAAAHALMGTPGSTASVTELRMLNDRAGFDAFIGRALGHADGDDAWSYCDERAARELAMAALRRLQTRHLSSHAPNTVARARMVGLGCTATLSSTTPHRGAHRAHIAIATCAGVTGETLALEKGRSRDVEELLVAGLIVRATAAACGLPPVPRELLEGALCAGDSLHACEVHSSDAVDALLAGDARVVLFVPDTPEPPITEHIALPDDSDAHTIPPARCTLSALRDVLPPKGSIIVSGSFNPLHAGHLLMARAAQAHAAARVHGGGSPPHVVFEMSVGNPDKPPLPAEEIRRRVSQFASIGHCVVVTRESLFVSKARVLPGSTFLVGYDTAMRLLDEKYYGGSHAGLVRALAGLYHHAAKFIVAGRVVGGGEFRTFERLAPRVPPGFEDMFVRLDEAAFRADVSSTAIRGARAAATPHA